MQVFVDLDGVLGDFDGHYEKLYGVRPNQDTYEPKDLWDNIRKHGSFYQTQPLMHDARELWEGVKKFHPDPVILTGIPHSIPNAAQQKKIWVRQHFGSGVEVICCLSKDKALYGKPGDILIDDRLKYAHFWTDMGGIFIQHTTAKVTLLTLAATPSR